MRAAQAAFDTLKPLIEAAQGPINPAALEAGIPPDAGRHSAGPTGAPAPPLTRVSPRAAPPRGRIHLALFCLLLVDAVLCLVYIALQGVLPDAVGNLIGLIVLLGGVVLSFAAIVRQRDSAIDESVKTVTWLVFAYTLVSVFALHVLNMRAAFSTMMQPGATMQSAVYEGRITMVWNFVSLCLDLLLGVSGLLLLRRWWRKEDVRTEAPQNPEDR
jgi:hypothetical protein